MALNVSLKLIILFFFHHSFLIVIVFLSKSDLKGIGKKSLPEGIMNGKSDSVSHFYMIFRDYKRTRFIFQLIIYLFMQLEGPCVVQIVKIRNLAAPKDNETSTSAPPFLKITLTDGVSNCNALVMEEIHNLRLNRESFLNFFKIIFWFLIYYFNSIETPPGTKLLLKGTVKAKTSSLLLTNASCQVLGGIVEQIYKKWKTNRVYIQF